MPVYLGTFFLSVSILALQVYLIRIFSITQWYHFASLVVSIAFFGFAASGTFLHIAGKIFEKIDTKLLLSALSLLYAVFVVWSIIQTNAIEFKPYWASFNVGEFFKLFKYYILLGLPFFIAGTTLCLLFNRMPHDASKLYFFNMLGSGVGCLLALWMLPMFGYKTCIIFAAIAIVGGVFFAVGLSGAIRLCILLSNIVIGLLLFLLPFPDMRLSEQKCLSQIIKGFNSRILATFWDVTSRVDLVESPVVRYAPGLSIAYLQDTPEQLGIVIDGDQLTSVTKYPVKDAEFFNKLPLSIPYQITKGSEALIINPGGGLSVLVALANNINKISVVEPERQIVQLMRGQLKDFCGNIYQHPKIDVFVTDARTFLKVREQQFDVIEIGLRESIFASTSGISGLSENYLFTVEAFKEYFKHLTPDGMLTITRWLPPPPPRDSIKLFVTACAALEQMGIKRPQQHIFMFRTIQTYTMMVKKTPFSKTEIDQIKQKLIQNRYDVIWYDGVKEQETNRFNKFAQPMDYLVINAFLQRKEEFLRNYPFDVGFTSDNRPFFSYYFRWGKLGELQKEAGMRLEPFFEGAFMIVFTLAQGILLSIIFIFLPMFFKRTRVKFGKAVKAIIYFFLIGSGFMFIEIPLLQFFILFLGHPVYAFSGVIFSLLIFISIGSFISRYVVIKKRALMIIFALLLCVILLSTVGSYWLLKQIKAESILFRYIVCFVLLAPMGFLLGFAFPLGIRGLGELDKNLIPWAWCLNGCASVISPVLATLFALYIGFSGVLFAAAILYLLAYFTFPFSGG